jgi:hypothetical protein
MLQTLGSGVATFVGKNALLSSHGWHMSQTMTCPWQRDFCTFCVSAQQKSHVCSSFGISTCWTAQYHTWLLIRLTPKAIVFPFLSAACMLRLSCWLQTYHTAADRLQLIPVTAKYAGGVQFEIQLDRAGATASDIINADLKVAAFLPYIIL